MCPAHTALSFVLFARLARSKVSLLKKLGRTVSGNSNITKPLVGDCKSCPGMSYGLIVMRIEALKFKDFFWGPVFVIFLSTTTPPLVFTRESVCVSVENFYYYYYFNDQASENAMPMKSSVVDSVNICIVSSQRHLQAHLGARAVNCIRTTEMGIGLHNRARGHSWGWADSGSGVDKIFLLLIIILLLPTPANALCLGMAAAAAAARRQ